MGVSSGKITDKKLGTAKVTVDILPNGRCIIMAVVGVFTDPTTPGIKDKKVSK